MPLVDLHDKRKISCMIIELLQWSLLHLLHLVVRAEAWLTSGYKGECPSMQTITFPQLVSCNIFLVNCLAAESNAGICMSGRASCLGCRSHMYDGSADIREQALAWIDFGLSLLPWPASAALAWLLQSGAKQHVGRAPTPPKSIAIILPDMPRNAAVTQSLAQCILWMAEAGLGHISVYDPQGAASIHAILPASMDRSATSECRHY